MSQPVTARDHALYVAALDAALDAFQTAYKKARKDAEPVFAAKYTDDGNDRQNVLLPDGEKISRLTIKEPSPVMTPREGAVEKFAREYIGDEAFEEYVLPAAIGSRQVVEAVKAMYPHLVRTRLRPATETRLLEQAEEAGGWLKDDETGAKEQVADITQGVVTGEFVFTGRDSKERRARLLSELLSGQLRGTIDLGAMLALPAGGEQDAA